MKLQSSGAIDVPLVSGREYLIGVFTSAGVGLSTSWAPAYPSFGSLTGRVRTAATSVPATLSVVPTLSAPHHQVLKTAR
jgi:hypothetical protein